MHVFPSFLCQPFPCFESTRNRPTMPEDDMELLGQMKNGRGMKGKGMEPCTYFHHSFANHSLASFFRVEQAGLAQSRQGAKEEGDELRELKLWVAEFDLFPRRRFP